MRIVGCIFLFVLLAAGCSQKDKIPSGVIGKEEMEKILWDMMLADQYAANYIVKDSASVNVKTETLKLYEEVFRLHKISREDFSRSFKFYQGRPDITRVMMDSLLARGNRARIENYTRPPAASTPTPVAPPTDTVKNRTVLPSAGIPVRPVKPRMGTPAGAGANSGTVRPPSSGTGPNGGGVSSRPAFLPNGRPLRAGENLFKPVKKDSVNKRQH